MQNDPKPHSINLFMLLCAPPNRGKSSAFDPCIEFPIAKLIEAQILKKDFLIEVSIFGLPTNHIGPMMCCSYLYSCCKYILSLQECTKQGLMMHLQKTDGEGVLASDEMWSALGTMLIRSAGREG